MATNPPVSPPNSKKSRITWDEEIIAEHDKFRGTRQIIDEPPTPYHYTSAAGKHEDDDNEEHSGHGILGQSAGENLNYDNLRPRGNSFHLATEMPGGGIKGDSMSIFDNWEGLNAKLTFHQMQQGEELTSVQAPSSSSNSSRSSNGNSNAGNGVLNSGLNFRPSDHEDDDEDEDAMDVDGAVSALSAPVPVPAPDPQASSVLRSSSRWAAQATGSTATATAHGQGQGQEQPVLSEAHRSHKHERPGDNGRGDGGMENGEVGAMHAGSEEGEGDAFKSKRAAHYNEFRLIQAMRAKQQLEDEDEEDEEEG